MVGALAPPQPHGDPLPEGGVEVALEVGGALVGGAVEQPSVELDDHSLVGVENVAEHQANALLAALADALRQPVGAYDVGQVGVLEGGAGAIGHVGEDPDQPVPSGDAAAFLDAGEQASSRGAP